MRHIANAVAARALTVAAALLGAGAASLAQEPAARAGSSRTAEWDAAFVKMADGTKRMFFDYTLPGMELVELSIPPLVKLDAKRGHAALKVAAVKKSWGRLSVPIGKRTIREHEKMKTIFANGGYC